MAEPDNILVTRPYIAYQSVGTQFIGGKHTHNYPAPDTHPRIAEDVDFEDVTNPAKTPSMDQLTKVFTFKYRQELAFSLLIDFLADEKNRTDFYADSDWARYALTIYEWNPCVLQKRPNTFKEWLPKFCELFGRPFVRDYEPNKLQFARENKIIPFLPLKETR